MNERGSWEGRGGMEGSKDKLKNAMEKEVVILVVE